MELLDTFVTAAVVAALGILLGFFSNGRFNELKENIAEFRKELKEDNAELRKELKEDNAELKKELKEDNAELKADVRDIRDELGVLRSDLTHVALAVGAKPKRNTS